MLYLLLHFPSVSSGKEGEILQKLTQIRLYYCQVQKKSWKSVKNRSMGFKGGTFAWSDSSQIGTNICSAAH